MEPTFFGCTVGKSQRIQIMLLNTNVVQKVLATLRKDSKNPGSFLQVEWGY